MRAGVRDERIFRTVAAVLLVSAFSVSGYHRHKAERAGEERSPAWQEEGLLVAVGLRSAGLTLMLSMAAYVLSPRRMEWSRLDLSPWLRWSGAGLGAASLPLAHWVFSSIGANITPTVTTRRDHELVTDGPYRWVRHPLYSVGSTFWISLSLLAANWFMGLASVAVLVMLLVRLPKEEARLIERFGDEYRAYTERTGCLLPRLR
jgi:protein-S-isoprenylcysteine O-methyltransferase Ste14